MNIRENLMISSSKGKIKELLIILPPKEEEAEIIFEVIRDLILKMEGVTFYIIEFEKRGRKTCFLEKLQKTVDNGCNDLVSKTVKLELIEEVTCWVRDSFVMRQSMEGHLEMLKPKHAHFLSKRRFDKMAERVAVAMEKYDLTTSSLAFEGGNILKADDFILVGQDSLHIEIEEDKINEDQADVTFVHELGGSKLIPVKMDKNLKIPPSSLPENYAPKHFPEYKIVRLNFLEDLFRYIKISNTTYSKNGLDHQAYNWLGKLQPLYHIDLFLTLLGKNKDNEEVILIGKATPTYTTEEIDHISTGYRLVQGAQQEFVRKAIKNCREKLETCLKDQGISYKIKEIPLPLTCVKGKSTSGKEDSINWFFASYNNCLVEVYKDKKTVYLPSYADPSRKDSFAELTRCDQEAANVFKCLGFEVISIKGNFLNLAEKGGSLHCITNDLRRELYSR